MADMLLRGVEWMRDKLGMHASREVAYRRGVQQVIVNATIGRTLLKLGDKLGGVRMEWTERDYLIPASALVINGQPILPDRDDKITEAADGKIYTYQVAAPIGEPVWRWSDPFRKIMRIHAKEVKVQ